MSLIQYVKINQLLDPEPTIERKDTILRSTLWLDAIEFVLNGETGVETIRSNPTAQFKGHRAFPDHALTLEFISDNLMLSTTTSKGDVKVRVGAYLVGLVNLSRKTVEVKGKDEDPPRIISVFNTFDGTEFQGDDLEELINEIGPVVIVGYSLRNITILRQ